MSFIGGNSAGYTALTVAERARQERQAREIERQAREQQEAQIAAAKVILRVWKRFQRRISSQNEMRRVWDKRTGFQAEKVAAAGAANLPLFILLFLRLYNIDHKDEFNVRLNFLSAKSAAGTATTVVSSQNLFRILPACIRRISQPDFETGPELRVILAFCTSSSSNHSSLSQESCIEFIGLLSDAIQPRVVQLFRQTSVSRTAAVATSLASNTAKRSHLWINSVLRFITGPIFLKIHFSMIQMFCTSFFTVPALCALLDNQAVEILAKSNLLDTIVHNTASLSFFLSECEAESALFLLANVICLFRRIKETPGLSCATVKAELNQAFIIPALLHIHTCASKASYTQHSSTQHHPIFGWSNRSLLHKHKHYDSFDAEGLLRMVISHQLSYIWSTPYIEDTFVSILEFDTAALAPSSLLVNNNSTANLPSSSSSIISKLGKFLSLSINSNSTNQASQVLSVTTIQAASLYLNLWTCLPPHRTNILNALAYNIPGLIPKLWQFIESDIGLDVFLRIVENSSASFSSSCSLAAEPLVTVLYVFCEACGILFLTLDDEDLYELERPFSKLQLSVICSFLNRFCFYWYWNGIADQAQPLSASPSNASSGSSATHNYNIITPAKRLLALLYDRNCRRSFSTDDQAWLVVSEVKSRRFVELILSGSSGEASTSADRDRALIILQNMPQTVPFKSRVEIFRYFIREDRAAVESERIGAQITIKRSHVLEDGFRQLYRLPSDRLKQTIKVVFINELRMKEAGIDQHGLFKEFLSTLCSAIFQPNLNIFLPTPSNDGTVVPSITSSITAAADGLDHLQVYEFCGKMLGKAVYEGITTDIPFAAFVYAKILGRHCFLEDLPTLEPILYKSLTFLKKYDGDCVDLGLAFSIDRMVFGKVETVEIKPGGLSIEVTNGNRFEYIYFMADYKLNVECKDQFAALVKGFRSIISTKWLGLFSPHELQKLMVGDISDFDVDELRSFTRYEGGYFDQHLTIHKFWRIVKDMSPADRRKFLKFATSCSKAPVGGFSHLSPPFTIRFVSEDQVNTSGDATSSPVTQFFTSMFGIGKDMTRLPTASTCFNLLKLPAYKNKSTLKEKLLYAINASSGFELS